MASSSGAEAASSLTYMDMAFLEARSERPWWRKHVSTDTAMARRHCGGIVCAQGRAPAAEMEAMSLDRIQAIVLPAQEDAAQDEYFVTKLMADVPGVDLHQAQRLVKKVQGWSLEELTDEVEAEVEGLGGDMEELDKMLDANEELIKSSLGNAFVALIPRMGFKIDEMSALNSVPEPSESDLNWDLLVPEAGTDDLEEQVQRWCALHCTSDSDSEAVSMEPDSDELPLAERNAQMGRVKP